MAQYLLLLEGRPAAIEADDAVTQRYNQRWIDWAGALAAEGKLAAGGPLAPVATEVTSDGATDRPMAPVDVYGFLLLQVDSADEAAEIAARAPNVELGGSAVIRPIPDVGG
jgi:hypothetical protein